ncbi:uncharacterized protein LOC124912564 [Impatiens glandulifera]|uniref:uncharacterized protein LOC124912564 n=1 Tax=Impatiens glandulifera TaxID=253017 RepID=UPI001FB11CCE|nr:uncharacterized protein LOC124912564 [Impatiens glandulifera]
MKTISGKISSTKAVSLSKAAKILSNFVVSEHEATPAVTAYLKRTSAAFNELVDVHKDLKSDRKRKRHSRSTTEEVETDHNNEVNQAAAAVVSENSSKKKHKEKKEKKRKDVN